MRSARLHCLVALAAVALSLLASQPASAALPEFSLLAGQEYPVTGEGTSHSDPHGVKLENLLGVQLLAEQVKATLSIASAGPSGALTLKLVKVKKGKATCRSTGQPEKAEKPPA